MTDHFAWYNAALRGIVGDIPKGEVRDGYYRRHNRDGTWTPIGIWHAKGEQIVRIGFGDSAREVVNPDAAWAEDKYSWWSKNVVPFAAYQAACRGEPWPDSAPEPTLPSNMPADPWERIKVEVEAETEVVSRHLAKPLTDESAQQITGIAYRIARLSKRADALREEEKSPHDLAAKAAQAKWKPWVDKSDALVKALKVAAGAFITAKRDKAIAEQRARDEAARKAREQAEWEAAEKGQDPPPPVVEAPAPKIETALRGVEGLTIAMRKVTTAKILDYEKALLALKDTPDIREVVVSLCNRAARGGNPIAGTEIETKEVAV